MYSINLICSCATLSNYEARKPSSHPPMRPISENDSDVEQKGWTLYRIAGCHLHPFPEAQQFSIDRDLPTRFGRFYAPNISTDVEDGIGAWSEDDFRRVM